MKKTNATKKQHNQTEQNQANPSSLFEWSKVGTRINAGPLLEAFGPKGFKAPPDLTANKSFKKGDDSFLRTMDVGVERIHAPDGGLGIPNSYLFWHYSMMVLFALLFSILFHLTTPMTHDEREDHNDTSTTTMTTPGASFPYLTLVHKLVIFFNMWESLGLGVLHGPLHQKVAPPFQDWWYRLTPGTMKYNAPFLKDFLNLFGIKMSMKRNYLDVLVEGFLTYIVSINALIQPRITPSVVFPVMLCSLYELFFDCGQHMHSYGTQNLHFFICMCFPVERGQVAGMQLFLHLFYFSSGFCKMGPTFQYMFSSNLLTAKFMVDVPWAKSFRNWLFQNIDDKDYRLKPAAFYLATVAGCIEMTLPFLTWFNLPALAYTSAFILVGMHIFIVSTLIIDVFVWNIVDATIYIILFTMIEKGVDWKNFHNMDLGLAIWLSMHALYVLYGHFFVDKVPYVIAHRHAAGNWSQGVMVIQKSALSKLSKLQMHAGIPSQDKLPPGWAGEWFAFQAFMAYVWNWNLPSRMLPPLVMDTMGDNPPTDGMYHSSGDYWLIHSVLFFDALIAHLRFDGLSNLDLIEEVGKVCEFEEGECKLCWVGAFPSFLIGLFGVTPRASWKVIDSKTGILKEGTFTVEDVMNPEYKRPSDISKTDLPSIVSHNHKEKDN